jgi:hypothetical protein
MATKTKILVTSEKEDTEREMAVVKQRTGTGVEADIGNSSSTKSHLKIMIMNTAGGKKVVDEGGEDKDEGGEGEDEGGEDEGGEDEGGEDEGGEDEGGEDEGGEGEDEGGEDQDQVEKDSTKRKRAIYDVVTNTCAALVLFQEFNWISIYSPGWKHYTWPGHLQYTGHKEASILFDTNEVTVKEYRQQFLDDTLNRMKDIQQGFAPFSRMCLRNIKTKGVPIVEFTCISWHGKHKMSLEGKKQEFESMLKYISEIWRETSLPVILAGDFNLEIKDIETLVSPPLVLHKYTPTERRKLNTIDFYISSKSLTMSDIKPLKLTSETNVTEVLSLLDHDPVVALMSTETKNKDTTKTQ